MVTKELQHLELIIWENVRVENAIEALATGDIEKLDLAINESHESLQNDYEVSCDELDLIRELAKKKQMS